MILDYENRFSDGQAVTATAVSDNVVDFGSDGAGPGEPLELLVQVSEDFASLTSLQVEVQTSADNSSYSTIASSEDAGVGDLEAGYQFRIRALPHGLDRYVRLRYVVTGSNATAGKVDAGIVVDKQQGYGHSY